LLLLPCSQQKTERKKKSDNTFVPLPFLLKIKTKKNEKKRCHLLLFKHKKRKENTNKKKNHRKKNAQKGGSLPFFSHFCVWDETFLLPSPIHIPSTLSSPPS